MNYCNSEFCAYQEKQRKSPHLGPPRLLSSVEVVEMRERQLEKRCAKDSPQCLQATGWLALQLTKGCLFILADFCSVNSAVRSDNLCAGNDQLKLCLLCTLLYFVLHTNIFAREYAIMWSFVKLSCCTEKRPRLRCTPLQLYGSGYHLLFMFGLHANVAQFYMPCN